MDTARRDKRYASDRPLLVRCDNWAEFVELYAADIGQGGMFIVTADAPEILSVIEIRMQLPEATEILLRARVVHVVPPEQAEAERKTAGVGVEFLDLDPERKRQIHHVIEFARWQGTTGDPNASLQRTLAELSQSLPPKELGSALQHSAPSVASPNPRKITLDGTQKPVRATDGKDPRKITLDGTQKPVRVTDGKDPRKITLDGTQKPVRVSSRAPSPSVPPREAGVSGGPPGADTPGTDRPGGGAIAADSAKIRTIMTHFAHKRYDVAIKECALLLAEHPGDAQAIKWQALCSARKALAGRDEAAAVQHYETALTHDEGNREARDFVRNYHRDKRLAALPFGRYFTKKK